MRIGKYTISIKLLIGIAIAILFVISLLFRILPLHDIINGDVVKYASNDAYYYMRLVDSQVHNFPHMTKFDPFSIYPGGSHVGGTLFFVWFQAFIIWIIGLGSPSQHLVDVMGAWFPPIMAALTIIPVYFIGKTLFNRWAGVLAAGLMAVLPGEFLGRTIIGSNDTPWGEVFFSTIAVAFLVMAIKTASQRGLTFNHLIKRDWKVIIKPLVLSLLAGVFLGLYLNAWFGALLFVFIISLYLIFQFILNHMRGKSSEYLGIVSVIFFLVALIVFMPFSPAPELSFAIVFAPIIPLVLVIGSWLMLKKGLQRIYYPLALVVLAVGLIAIAKAAYPNMFNALWGEFKFVFFPGGSTATTTQEMQHFLSPQGTFSTAIAWGNFTTSFFLFPGWAIPGFAFVSLVILLYLFIKRRGDERTWLLFFIWTLVMLVATLVQRRFAYYFVVNVALLSAYISWQIIWYAGLRKLVEKPEPTLKGVKTGTAKARIKESRKNSRGITVYHVNTALAIVVVFVLVFLFNIIKSKQVAAAAPYAPSDAWQASLTWMKDNTPEPLGADTYYKVYDALSPGEQFKYPDTVYGVTSWWDYGYWISRIAHRIPNTNPSQAGAPIQKTAELFLSTDESRIQEIVKEFGSDYIVADYSMLTSKFWAIVNWAGRPSTDFFETYYYIQGTQATPIQVINTDYYNCLLVRLFNFDGKAVTNVNPVVITYAEKTDNKGQPYKQITDVQQFNSYQEAVDYINKQGPSTHKIVGNSPFISPIPLEAVTDYQEVYSSDDRVQYSNNATATVPEVKIFEYTKK